MDVIEYKLHREVFHPAFTLGKLFKNGERLGYTCEDKDRELENGGEKVYGKTAIPRGRYRLTVSMSNRFKKIMPEVLNVPGFSGIRIHGGNKADDTLGCPLLGEFPTADGVRQCAGVNAKLILSIMAEEKAGNICWLTVS